MSERSLDDLVEAVAASPKYRQVSVALIRAIGRRELHHRRSWKAAVKATKNKLHQVGGAYQTGQPDYKAALVSLQNSRHSPAEFRAVCREIMGWHASTRERLPILDRFYGEVLQNVGPVNSVLDVASGLNPLAWPWMPFGSGVTYTAYDIYADTMHFVQRFMNLAGINGRAAVRDVLDDPPMDPADLALVLKTLPCLEQLDKLASTTLLDALQARYLVVSYPVTSLGGRRKGMLDNYSAHFHALAAGRPWSVKRFEFSSELAFLVDTGQ